MPYYSPALTTVFIVASLMMAYAVFLFGVAGRYVDIHPPTEGEDHETVPQLLMRACLASGSISLALYGYWFYLWVR